MRKLRKARTALFVQQTIPPLVVQIVPFFLFSKEDSSPAVRFPMFSYENSNPNKVKAVAYNPGQESRAALESEIAQQPPQFEAVILDPSSAVQKNENRLMFIKNFLAALQTPEQQQPTEVPLFTPATSIYFPTPYFS